VPATALEVQPEHFCGLTADELAERIRRPATRPFPAAELTRWLLACGFAVEDRGVLFATPLGVELGGALRPLEGA